MRKEMHLPFGEPCSKHKTFYSVARAHSFGDNPIPAKFPDDFVKSPRVDFGRLYVPCYSEIRNNE